MLFLLCKVRSTYSCCSKLPQTSLLLFTTTQITNAQLDRSSVLADSLVVDLTRLKWRCVLALALLARLWGKFTAKVIRVFAELLQHFSGSNPYAILADCHPGDSQFLNTTLSPAHLAFSIFKLSMRRSVPTIHWVSPTCLLPNVCCSPGS